MKRGKAPPIFSRPLKLLKLCYNRAKPINYDDTKNLHGCSHQRTTLHLTEIWDFLDRGRSNLDFPKGKLDEARSSLSIDSASRESGPLEYILVKTSKEISYRIYEDGLIILEKDFKSLKNDFEAIRIYYDNKLSKALSLIFSKGAPNPKELANIKTILPYIVTVTDATKEETDNVFRDFSRGYLFCADH